MPSGTSIQALVLQKGTTNFYKPSQNQYGTIMLIPTPGAGGLIDGDYLATYVTDYGIDEGGLQYSIISAGQSPLPAFNAIPCCRISTTNQGADDWYIAGTSLQYISTANAAECCSGTNTNPLPTTIPPAYPCQLLCNQDPTTFLFFGVFGIPSLPAGQNYYAAGYFNGVALTALSGSGYASPAALLAAFNTNWNNVGTWTSLGSPATFVVTEAAGTGTDLLCIRIFTM